MKFLDSKKSHEKEDHWIPLSDLMTGLMLIFLLIAMVFMVKLEQEKQVAEKAASQLRDIGTAYSNLRNRLYIDLFEEFKNDLPKWRATLDKDLAIRFEEPEGQFRTGESILQDPFKRILDSFAPRYVKILSNPTYAQSIEEIRIEGHTSSLWKDKTALAAYFENMRLSQDRTRSTLEYVATRPNIGPAQKWLISKITAIGLSSSKLRFLPDGSEDTKSSQRVEFRVRLNANEQMEKLLSGESK
jgi:outer membrane protein OmpA-like peptidoglycan-associated protein